MGIFQSSFLLVEHIFLILSGFSLLKGQTIVKDKNVNLWQAQGHIFKCCRCICVISIFFWDVLGQINSGYSILPSLFIAKAQRQLKSHQYRACPNNIKGISCVGIRWESKCRLDAALAGIKKENTVRFENKHLHLLPLFYLGFVNYEHLSPSTD